MSSSILNSHSYPNNPPRADGAASTDPGEAKRGDFVTPTNPQSSHVVSLFFGALGRSKRVPIPSAVPATRPLSTASTQTPPGGQSAASRDADITNIYRRYVADLTSSSPLHGNTDSWCRAIRYEVGVRGNTIKALLKIPTDVPAPDMSINTTFVVAAEFAAYARKNSNFSGVWDAMDLAGIAEQLAASVAAYSVFGKITCSDVRGGMPVSVVAMGAVTQPITANMEQVFIPRISDTTMHPDVFAVISAAANAYGAQVVTDIVQVDASTNSVIVPTCADSDLAVAAVEGMRLLLSNYAAVGAEALIGYAIIRGIHRVLTVVGHTDEGGAIRDVLRRGKFRIPYGGIHTGIRTGVEIARIVTRTPAAAANWCDDIALISAASVAHCDPCVSHQGAIFPTVLESSNQGANEDPTAPPIATDDDSRKLTAELAGDIPRFSPIWFRAIAKMFGLPGGDESAGIRHFNAVASSLAGTVHRHFKQKSMAPYYWIEPTSLIPHMYFGTTAEAAGFGSLATSGRATTMPGFERVHRVGGQGNVAYYHLGQRCARTSAMLTHLAGNPKDGLANMSVRQADPGLFVHVGASPTEGRDSRQRMENNEDFASWMWTRGQSPIPAPSEWINTAAAMVIAVVHGKLDETTWITKPTHVPHMKDFTTMNVEFFVTKPRGIDPARLDEPHPQAIKVRTRGALALEMARANLHPDSSSEQMDFPVKFEVPVSGLQMAQGADTSRKGGDYCPRSQPAAGLDGFRAAEDTRPPANQSGAGGVHSSIPFATPVGSVPVIAGGAGGNHGTARGPSLHSTVVHGTTAGPRPPNTVAGAGGAVAGNTGARGGGNVAAVAQQTNPDRAGGVGGGDDLPTTGAQ